MSTYCIGDIHGCFDELIGLLKLINYDQKLDSLRFVGDLVNRGPKSLEVLRLIRKLPNVITVLGNHDLYWIVTSSNYKNNSQNICSIDEINDLVKWLSMQPLMYYDYKFDCVIVHAGIYPIWDIKTALTYAKKTELLLQSNKGINFLKYLYNNGTYNKYYRWMDNMTLWQQYCFTINCCTKMRICNYKGDLEFKYSGSIYHSPNGYYPWFEHPFRQDRDKKIIFGHWSGLSGKTNNKSTITIDTGCIWGKTLTALRLDDGKYYHYPSAIKLNLL